MVMSDACAEQRRGRRKKGVKLGYGWEKQKWAEGRRSLVGRPRKKKRD